MNLTEAVAVIAAKGNVDVKHITGMHNVQFVTDRGVTISIGYGTTHYGSNRGVDNPAMDTAYTVEVYAWKKDGSHITGGKFRFGKDGLIGWLPCHDLPGLVNHIARYVR